ncbi:Protein of unknown function [Alteromonadaceae bacterium Bs31]|nr:Protein of unknown function [Alteromonadaceae bacterium Bs31]
MTDKNDKLSVEEQQFWNTVDSFLDSANNQAQECDPGIVASAVMYAAARYCAFNLACLSESRKDFLEDTQQSINHLTDEFKKLLEENMEDYGENFKVYLKDE